MHRTGITILTRRWVPCKLMLSMRWRPWLRWYGSFLGGGVGLLLTLYLASEKGNTIPLRFGPDWHTSREPSPVPDLDSYCLKICRWLRGNAKQLPDLKNLHSSCHHPYVGSGLQLLVNPHYFMLETFSNWGIN